VGELDVAASFISGRAGKTCLLVLLRSMQKTSLGRARSMLLAFFYCEKATFHALMENSCPIRMVKLALACYVSWDVSCEMFCVWLSVHAFIIMHFRSPMD
jgi:hypothetical protein